MKGLIKRTWFRLTVVTLILIAPFALLLAVPYMAMQDELGELRDDAAYLVSGGFWSRVIRAFILGHAV